MKINGNLFFNNANTDELQNAKIQQVDMGADPANFDASTIGDGGSGNVTGRILWNTNGTSGTGYYFYDGADWVQFAQGGDATALQNEVNAIEEASGDIFDDSGNWDNAPLSGSIYMQASTSLADALLDLDNAIDSTDTLAELNDVNAGDNWSLVTGDVLRFNGSTWENAAPGATSGVQPYDAALTALSAVAGTGILVQTAADTFVTRSITSSAVNGELGITITNGNGVTAGPSIGLDLVGLTALGVAPATGDSLPIYDLDATTNKKVTVANLTSTIQANTDLGDLADITDAQSGSLVTDDKYFFNADGISSYEVVGATLGALNNVAASVDSASNEDVLAFDGSSWTAVTPATFAGDLEVGDIGDVELTAVATNDLLQFAGGSPGSWENVAIGSASGVQAWDAGLDALAAAGAGMVSMNGDTVAFRTIAGTTSNVVVTNGDGTGGNPTINLATVTNSGAGTFLKLTRDTFGRVSGTTAVVAGDITALVDGTYVNVSGDTMTGNLIMSAGTDVVLPDVPVNATDAVNKQYVDNLVSSGTEWIEPNENPDFVGIVDAEPSTPIPSGMYIVSPAGDGGTWTGSISVSAGEMMHWIPDGIGGFEWDSSGIISNGDNLLVGVFTDALDGDSGEGFDNLPVNTFYLEDYTRYIGAAGAGSPSYGDLNDASSWDFPYGRGPSHPGWTASGDGVDTITVTGQDITHSIKVGNVINFDGTDFTVTSVSFSTDTTITVGGVPTNGSATLLARLRDGGTTTTLNQDDAHNGTTYLYSANDSQWVAISGPGAVGAGVGLSYSGTTLNVNLGAGIVELPTDEVGLDLESGKAVQLTSTATGGLLTFVLDGSSLTQSGAGLKIAANGITGTELDASIAGDGLSLTTVGSPAVDQLDVNVDDVTIEINADALQVKDGGIANVKLADSTITTDADTGTGGSIALGGTLQIAGGEGIDTSIAGGVFTIAGENASDSNKGIASFAAADFTVSSGAVSIATGGVSNNQLDNSTITMSGDSGSDAVALGETLTVAGGTLATTTVTANTVTIDVAASTSDLDDVTAAATASGHVMVADGANDYTPRHVSYVHTQSTSSATWTINHNLGQKFVNVTVYDSSDEVIIPQSITATDANTTDVTLNTAITGTVVVMGVAGSATGSA